MIQITIYFEITTTAYHCTKNTYIYIYFWLMKTLTKYAVVLPLFFFFSAVKAQDSIPPAVPVNQDSLRFVAFNKKIQLIENQRVADSIKKAELLAEIQSLKTTDNLKKETLQAQLEAISNQEADRLASKKRR